MTLGDRVRAERTARGWSQAELARRVSALAKRKISQVAIHHIESRGDVSPRFLLELAETLGVLPDWLRTGKGHKTWAEQFEESIADFRGPPLSPTDKANMRRVMRASRRRSRGLSEDQDEYDIRSVMPLTHYVEAGDEVHSFEEGDPSTGITPFPPGFAELPSAAVIIKDDLLSPFFVSGDVLFFRKWQTPNLQKLPERPVIVQLRDDRQFLKRIISGSKRGHYHLLSLNPLAPLMQDQQVQSFAPIEWIAAGMLKEPKPRRRGDAKKNNTNRY